MYGCNKAANEGMLSWTKTRLLPKIFAANEPIFCYPSCRFNQDKEKLNTARVVVWNEMGVFNSFTLETSMYGKNNRHHAQSRFAPLPQRKPAPVRSEQFVPGDFQNIAHSMLSSIKHYTLLVPQLEKDSWLKPSQLVKLGEEAV